MSEYIDNGTRRKETMKNVLRMLHEGKSVESVKEEFGALAREVTSAEIAEIEQQLISEGLPVEEVQRLCDVHVAVFREGLEEQKAPDTIPGHPVFTFRSENQTLDRAFNALDEVISAYSADPSPVKLETVRGLLERLRWFERHYLREENLLFPYLEKYGFTGPTKVMWGVHDQIRAMIKNLIGTASAGRPDADRLAAGAGDLANAMREMIYKEEKILYPASLSHLNDADWASIREQEEELGYFLVRPGTTWKPQAAAPAAAPAEAPVLAAEGDLPLQTGLLSLEQINLMLTNLPVDVTFVDENDTVRFFSQGKERIFERQAAIIGRKVQNCHPPQSVNRVQQIIDDFRAGKRSHADFWIQMAGKFIHIRYFAMRDEAGKYRGTLEVTQDISGIRQLEGERRLLDDRPAA